MGSARDKKMSVVSGAEGDLYEPSETENNLHELSEAMLVARIEDWISQQ